jgi:hypothetical protein
MYGLFFNIFLYSDIIKMKELVMINRECDRKNQFFNITDWTEQQIQDKIKTYDRTKWFPVFR